MIELRPEVQAFAEAMERKLRQNDHKGGWKNESPVKLFVRASEEMGEADEILSLYLFDGRKTTASNQVLHEMVDVANYLMMVADNCGALHEAKE